MSFVTNTDELIALEAQSIARHLLEVELEKQNLPLPKDPQSHIDIILSKRPDITATAKQRVEARTDAYTEGLKAIGIDLSPIKAIEVDLWNIPER